MANKHLHLIDGKREFFIEPQNILFVQAAHNYCDVYFVKEQNRETIRVLIGKLWSQINSLDIPHTLIRIHKSFIVNIRYVTLFDRKEGKIVLECGEKNITLNVAKAREKDVKEKVDILKGDNRDFPELKREDCSSESEFKLKKSVEDVKKTMARMNDLYLLAKSLNNSDEKDK